MDELGIKTITAKFKAIQMKACVFVIEKDA